MWPPFFLPSLSYQDFISGKADRGRNHWEQLLHMKYLVSTLGFSHHCDQSGFSCMFALEKLCLYWFWNFVLSLNIIHVLAWLERVLVEFLHLFFPSSFSPFLFCLLRSGCNSFNIMCALNDLNSLPHNPNWWPWERSLLKTLGKGENAGNLLPHCFLLFL